MRLTLKTAILSQRRSQRELARATGIRENRMSGIVRGWVIPRPDERAAIATALGRSSRGLFRNKETMRHEAGDDAAA
jgi:transcriptional regulator with XRE-family HTH domain